MFGVLTPIISFGIGASMLKLLKLNAPCLKCAKNPVLALPDP